MTSSESESENDQSDDDMYEMHGGPMVDTYDGGDDFYDFDDIHGLTSLRDLILGKNTTEPYDASSSEIPEDYTADMALSSTPELSNDSNTSKPAVNDSLRMYLIAPPLIRRTVDTQQPHLSIDPTLDDFQSKIQSTSELYVGNIPSTTKPFELKAWFIDLGHNVSLVDVRTNKRGAHFAFVRFDCLATAKDVLYISESEVSNLTFNGNKLNIKPRQRGNQKSPIDLLTAMTINLNEQTTTSIQIADISYGTLLTGPAMRNIQGKNSIVANDHAFGIIGHHLMNYELETTFRFNIDTAKQKLSIVGHFDTSDNYMSDTIHTLKFEWNFQDLKGKKITPVLINQKNIFLLLEVKRPPIILETQNISVMDYDTTNETRLPGTLLIGHANAWLFQLSSDKNVLRDYFTLFRVLNRYNLSPRQFRGDNIIHLMSSPQAVKKNFTSVQLISNEDWVQRNQDKVDDFFQRRWSSYPFETKFEIMKLISKHIITVYDLIVDEQAENILKLCTTNTLIALTDKIVEFASQWFSTTCDHDDEDWDIEDNEEQSTEPEADSVSTLLEDIPTIEDDSNTFSHLRLSTNGASVQTTDTNLASLTTIPGKSSLGTSKNHLGTFNRLLISAVGYLLKNYQLRKTPSGILVTKLEIRTPNVNSFLIRKIYITPSTVFYEGPYREEKCAATRAFEQYQDRFLRVTFRDEDYRVLHNYNDNMSKVYERIKTILNTGVNVCNRNYQFLAFSSSQLREHSCWMFSEPDKVTTVDSIRQWMGDFKKVHPVAKYAARLGQSFSTSIKGIKLETNQFKEIDDCTRTEWIRNRSRARCFTDGIGIISAELAKKLARELYSSDRITHPSAFQIRCGGFKGMVCVDAFNCIKEPNHVVHFRKSMNKFDAQNFSIDVVRTSLNPSVAFLNRQIILLLSSLGVPNQNFLDLQNRMLSQLTALTEDPLEAIKALKDLNEFGGNGFHGFLIAYMKRLGRYKDPFVWRLLRVFKAFLVKELRTKAKIRVQDSWSLLGVVDESRTLQYGQVFIQIDNTHHQRDNPTKEIFRGPVVVTRNPCFHPGDIRRLEAVDIPAFHDLKNVIVFPMQGPRSHAQEMSGGDLDGDTFWISRHPKLLFETNEDPFDYQDQDDDAKAAHPPSPNPHTIREVCNFFGEYIAADNLGLIANSHLAFADQLPDGAKNDKCLTLARMHSVAVDFAKNGESAPRLTRELRPQEYPHYMEKRDKKSRHSDTILGILYDKIEYYNTDLQINEEAEIRATSSFPYKYFFIDKSNDYMQEANIMKKEYDRDVKRVMRQYGITHEVEVVSGYILRFTSKQYANESKMYELRNEIIHAYKAIQDKYLRFFWQEFYQRTEEAQDEEMKWSKISKQITWKNQLEYFELHGSTTSDEEVKKKASAWFRITYQPWINHIKKTGKNSKKHRPMFTTDQRKEDQVPRYKDLFSFAWLVYPVLLNIYQERENDPDLNIESKKKKKKKKKENKVPPVSSNNSTKKN